MCRTMKRIGLLAFITMLALLTLTACGKSEFGLSENTGKRMTITAVKADRDAFFMAGSLEVADGEQVVLTSGLTKGAIRVDLVGTAEEQSIDKLPETDGEAAFTADVSGTESTSFVLPAGDYLLRATCLEKTTGTVRIEAKPAA